MVARVRKSREPPQGAPEQPPTDTVAFDYIKGGQFRTIHPDGVIGSITPQGRVELAFFCERQAIPKRVVHQLNADGTLGDAVQIESRESIVREIDFVVSMSTDVANRTALFILEQVEKQTARVSEQGIKEETSKSKKSSKDRKLDS